MRALVFMMLLSLGFAKQQCFLYNKNSHIARPIADDHIHDDMTGYDLFCHTKTGGWAIPCFDYVLRDKGWCFMFSEEDNTLTPIDEADISDTTTNLVCHNPFYGGWIVPCKSYMLVQ